MGGTYGKVIGVLGAASVLVLAVSGAALAIGGPVTPLPTESTFFSVAPKPVPKSSQGRIPVGLRLLDRIRTTDGSHPPALKTIRIQLDKQYGLHLAKLETCAPEFHYDIRTPGDPCAEVKFGTGTITVETAFPEQQPVSVSGRAIAFKRGPGKVMIDVYLPAPITGRIAIPITIGKGAEGRYGLEMTAKVPKIAGGYGSITSLDMRFRRGVFSAACSSGDLQSSVVNSLADGSRTSAGVAVFCGAPGRTTAP